MTYIILAAVYIAIAIYYTIKLIKLIKFYYKESKEQNVKNQIISDLRAGRISRQLVGLILGDGGYRITHNQLDVIFEWMVQNTNAWRVHTYADEKVVVVFLHSPFHPEEWDNYEDYKHVMRQMFGEYGTKDFLTYRSAKGETYRIRKNLATIDNPIKLYDYVTFDFNEVRTIGMVTGRGVIAGIYAVKILSRDLRGQHLTIGIGNNVARIEPDEAVKELARQKEEWKTKKLEEAIAKRREAFRKKWGNLVRGSYLKNGNALYIAESINIEEGKAMAVRLLDLGLNFPAGEKCILPLDNGFILITAEEAAEILLKEYSNE